MVFISKPKSILFLLLAFTLAFTIPVWYAHSIPAPGINSICEPGGCSSQDCSYFIYKNNINSQDNTTLAKNCVTGANDFLGIDSAALIQSVFDFISTVPKGFVSPVGISPGPQFSIVFGVGLFFIPRTIIFNPTLTDGARPGSYAALHIRGQGEDKTGLVLANGANNWMFNFTNIGDKFQIQDIKFFGNQVGQTGHTSGIFYFSGRNIENIWDHTEFRDCLTACVDFAGTGGQWNIFNDVWMLAGPKGFVVDGTGYTDWRWTSCKFDSMNGGAIRFNVNSGIVTITGSNFVSSGLFFDKTMKGMTIVGNVFTGLRDQTIYFGGTGLAALTNFQTLIASNVFNETTTPTHRAIYLSNFVDGITITSNSFNGYTSSATVPVTLIQTTQKLTTLVTQNSGMGSSWTGFGITQPAVPASTIDQQNTNPYQVRIYITAVGSGITAYKVTDPSGTSNTFTTTVSIGFTIELDPYAKVALTYTGTPTWKWFGEANLS